MRKIVAFTMSVLFLLSVSARGMASTASAAIVNAGNTGVPVSGLPDAPVPVKPAESSMVGVQSASFELAEGDARVADPLGQAAPTPVPQKQPHRSHTKRTILILVAVGVAMPIVFAILDN